MISRIQILLSNQTEALYQQFKEQLFDSATNPFTKRLVVVPSKAMKNWLTLRLAEDLGIATGVEFCFLESALRFLEDRLTPSHEKVFKLPPQMELALKIENEMRSILGEPIEELWSPLREHIIDEKKGVLTRKGEKRLVVIADQLAVLFHQYEKHGQRMLKRWLKGPQTGWQEVLWYRIVGNIGPERINWQSGNVTVHLFALSYLSRQQQCQLCDLSEKIQIFHYLLSPCEVYWSDLLSDRENRKLIRCWEEQGMSNDALTEATELLFERNPLLGNWGKLGRLMAAQIEESTFQIDENYQEIDNEMCCLHALQMDLLKLRHGKHLPKREFQEDQSIQVHVTQSKTREVQALYQTLLGLIDRHADDDEKLNPKDIIVMAPNIKVYEPMIRAVFQSQQSVLDCQIMDLNLLDQNDVIKGFFHLLNLSETRWDNDTILNLFSFKSFQEKQSFSQMQVDKIGKWVRESGIRWGIDAEHRSELLLKNHCDRGMIDKSAAGTWKMGIDRLLLGTAMILPTVPEDKVNYSRRPLKEINSTDQELLGNWAALMHALKEDLRPLSDGVKKSLKDWSDYLLFLLYRYFAWNYRGDEEKEQVASLINCIENLKVVTSVKSNLFPFSTIVYHLKNGLENKEVHYRENHFQSVRFCSMLPMRAVPAKVVVMMGMSEENYPKKKERMVLNQLYHQEGVDPFPNTTDFDRYLFLEAVMSARQYLVLSFHKRDQSKNSLNQCSLLISELMQYLDQSFSIGGIEPSKHCVYAHPFFSFDKRYFQKENKISSFSIDDYQAALSYYNTQTKRPHQFIPDFTIGSSVEDSTHIIDLKEIKKLARNPVRFYFQKKLGMYLNEEEEIPSDESLTISSLDLSKFRKQSWWISSESILNGAELEGVIPVGPFKELSIGKIEDAVAEVAEQMKEFSIQPEDLFEVVFSENCETPFRADKKWYFPPLSIVNEEHSYTITGSLGECSAEGMTVHKKGDIKDIVECWPLYLIWCKMIEEYDVPFKKELLFIKNGERKVPFFESSLPFLLKYLQYYQTAIEDVSPLIPDWVAEFATGTAADLKNAVEKSVEGDRFYNDEIKWLCRDGNVLLSDHLYRSWSSRAKEIFDAPIEYWSGGKK